MIGAPGSGPRRLARRRIATRAVILVAGSGAAMAGAVADSRLVVAVAVAATVAAVRRYRPLIARARAGADAEEMVATALRRCRAGLVAHSVRLPEARGDLDVVILGPVAAVIEVKRASGRTVVRSDGTVRVGRRLIPGNPARQVLGGAASLRRFLGDVERVDAVLCVTGMRQRPRWVEVGAGELVVCSARHLGRVVRRLPSRLDARQAARAIGRLDAS
jgi:hypothetical protein